jgi:hypothetical protein
LLEEQRQMWIALRQMLRRGGYDFPGKRACLE